LIAAYEERHYAPDAEHGRADPPPHGRTVSPAPTWCRFSARRAASAVLRGRRGGA
jgi:hypothetical protein